MKKIMILSFCALLFALSFSASAQQAKKVPRIGYLTGTSVSVASARTEAFQQGLRDLGYLEGKNMIIEWRGADGNRDRQRALAVELVRLNSDVIVTGGSTSTRAAREATSTIPIVMTQDDDPVGSRFIASLARPGGNITGLSTLSPELSGKRLELLKEFVPGLSRVAVLRSTTSAGQAQESKEIERAAEALRVKIQYVNVLAAKDIDPAFRAAVKGRSEAVLMMASGTITSSQRLRIAELAIKNHLPVMYHLGSFAEAGGLMYYGFNSNDLSRRAATYVDKILKGAKPADLPVEQPTKFEFIINLKAAKQIGLTIPPNVLARADRVIR
jgi:putative ABC transport system substrate-binding protein